MAHYSTTVTTSWSPEKVFAYMADMTNFASWDPGVLSATLVEGERGQAGSSYDLEVKAVPKPITMRYELIDADPPNRVRMVAETKWLTSIDQVDIGATKDGAVVTYDAILRLNGPGRFANPLVGLFFNRIGDKAAAGLRRALGAG